MRSLACVLVAIASPALAQELRPVADAITVARADECLTHDDIVSHVEIWLEHDAIDARISIVLEDGAQGAGFVILRDGTPAGARQFDRLPARCEDRRAVLGLAIAMALDAAVLRMLAEPRPEPEPEPEPEARPEPQAETASLHVGLDVVAHAQVLIEVLPEVAAAWQLGARVVIDGDFELGAYAWASSVSGAALDPGRVDAQISGARLDVCVRRAIDVVTLRGCAGGAAGAAFGTGRDVANARSSTVPFAGLIAGASIALALAEFFAIELEADGWISLLRPRFDLVERDVVRRSAPFPVGGAIIGVGARLSW